MLGYKDRHSKTHPLLTLEELVPEHHFVRKLEARVWVFRFISWFGFLTS
jgi:hypothetical protein